MLGFKKQFLAIIHCQERQIGACGRVAGEMGNRRVGREDPTIFIGGESYGIINIHLN